jgi:Trp operon repressor
MREETSVERTCSIDGCGRVGDDARGMCGMHAQRVRRYGDPNYVTSHEKFRENCRNGQPRLGLLKRDSYPKLNGRHEHRVVAERKLGRALLTGEIVHHKDGNRHNNAPENLEVITQAQHIREHRQEMLLAQRVKASKLTPESVAKIRQLLKSGRSQREIGATFGVSQATISGIQRGRTWRDA